MAAFDERRVPRGTSHRWEVLIADDEHERPQGPRRMAIEFQRDHRVLREVPGDLLRDIPLVDEGTRLERRGDYLDFHDPARGGFRAEGSEVVKPGQRVISRAELRPEAWDELCAACDRVARRRPLPRAS